MYTLTTRPFPAIIWTLSLIRYMPDKLESKFRKMKCHFFPGHHIFLSLNSIFKIFAHITPFLLNGIIIDVYSRQIDDVIIFEPRHSSGKMTFFLWNFMMLSEFRMCQYDDNFYLENFFDDIFSVHRMGSSIVNVEIYFTDFSIHFIFFYWKLFSMLWREKNNANGTLWW